MMRLGSKGFDEYDRNLRRIMWAEFIDQTLHSRRAQRFRASLVDSPFEDATPAVRPEVSRPTRGVRLALVAAE